MTPQRFQECLDQIGWTQRGLAARLKVHASTVQRWGLGHYSLPQEVEHWLNRLAAAHVLFPAPQITLSNDNAKKGRSK